MELRKERFGDGGPPGILGDHINIRRTIRRGQCRLRSEDFQVVVETGAEFRLQSSEGNLAITADKRDPRRAMKGRCRLAEAACLWLFEFQAQLGLGSLLAQKRTDPCQEKLFVQWTGDNLVRACRESIQPPRRILFGVAQNQPDVATMRQGT